MQWTDESGRAYGEDPYGGAGYAYAYGYEYSGGAATDTATMPWDPVQLGQWTHPTGSVLGSETDPYATGMDPCTTGTDLYATGTDPYATGTDLYATGTDPYVTGPGPAATTWDSPHGDVLTVPPPELDDAADPHIPGPETLKTESARPVFVDSSGRRQRRALRAARLLVIPAGGYVALLISTVLGGPSLNAPFVPQSDSTHPATPSVSAPDASPSTGGSAGSVSPTTADRNSRPTAAQKTSGSTGRPTASATTAATPGSTAEPTGTTSPTPAPTATATSHPASKGRAVGSSRNPVK
ncbi:hypothetical protein ACFV2X_09520 [Streptomyces sp. NPDC059679]|uniref:hypothetical protein n=1 Tax=Streptomyces sp. NPDC059679 TaxID=3346903 RepID=UPI0036B93D60